VQQSVVVPWFADHYAAGVDWRAMAWWIHDHLPYSQLQFFPKLAAFNIGWRERPRRRIDSFIAPRGCLTRPGMTNQSGDHSRHYPGSDHSNNRSSIRFCWCIFPELCSRRS
jgi:hypothetical protein